MEAEPGGLGARPRLQLGAQPRVLLRAGGQYLVGEQLRSEQPEAKAALSRVGRYHRMAGNLEVEVEEVQVEQASKVDRFVICLNPEVAKRDAAVREQLLAQLEEKIKGSDRLSEAKRRALAGAIKSGLKRFLRVTPGGMLRIDRKAVATEQALDGRFLVRASDPSLSPEDVALGSKQLLKVERGWRDFKLYLNLRPVFHRAERKTAPT